MSKKKEPILCRNCGVSSEDYFISPNGFCCRDCEDDFNKKNPETSLKKQILKTTNECQVSSSENPLSNEEIEEIEKGEDVAEIQYPIDEVAVLLNERSRQIRDVLKELLFYGGESCGAAPEEALSKINSILDRCYLEIDKMRREVSKTLKTEIFSASVMKLQELKNSINAFTAGKIVRNISMQEVSDLIVCMVSYEE